MPKNDRFAISAGHELTLKVAQEVLGMGGNAFDAAVAAHFTMYISEPCMASAGSGGFAMCYTPEIGPKLLDFFTQTPKEKQYENELDFRPIVVDFGNEQETFHLGMASMAVPGSVAGMYTLNKELGSLPINELLDLVISFTKDGVLIDSFQQIDLDLLSPILASSDYAYPYFFKNNNILKKGELLCLPDYIDFLDFLKQEGESGFYKGEISKIVSNDSKERGGFIRRVDFENYGVEWRTPIKHKYRNHQILCPPLPSIGGLIIKILFHFLEIENLSWAEAVSKVLKRCENIQDYCNLYEEVFNKRDMSSTSQLTRKGTSHFNIIDADQNAIALTCSLGEGSGYFIPGTLMQMNNMLGESFLLPDGFHSWKTNARLNSMMSPTMVLDNNDQLFYMGGSGGAGRIPFMVAKVIDNVIKGMDLENATLAPRIYYYDNKLQVEKDYDEAIPKDIDYKIWNEPSLFFGGVHSIVNDKSNYRATGDARRYGVSLTQ